MVAQHQSYAVAQRFDIAQDLQRSRASGHQIAGQPQRISPRIEFNLR